MKNLNKEERIAVVVGIFIVGFFFIFGQTALSIFKLNNQNNSIAKAPEVVVQNDVIGGGAVAEVGDRVTVNYTGRFVDGTVFDSSLTRHEPFSFNLGSGQVIKGWDKGIVGMREGGKRTISIPPELGYGTNDYGPIPGGSTLIFDIELLKVEKPH